MFNLIDRSKFAIMFALVIMIMAGLPSEVAAQNECASKEDCEAKYRPGSVCLESGQCSNPFVDGCLRRMDPDTDFKRLCNSDDKDQENCRPSSFNYPEIRVHNQNWEVAIFFSWILQVSLMELLDVPVSVGLDNDTSISSFYNIENNLPYSSVPYAWEALRKANEVENSNCLLTDEKCAHVMTDVWMGQNDVFEEQYKNNQLDYLDGNGQVGKISWFVPRFTASRHPFAVTHMGLSQDPQRLARVFKRPTSWIDYCHEVSPTNCSVPDNVTDRYPNEAETGVYFANGYDGYFRENNCTSTKCTGHIVAPPCTWTSFVEAQAYWNNISLESTGSLFNDGYTYGEMLQIWNAANATKSDVMMWWFEPDAFLEQYRGKEAEFTKVYLPTPSIKCNEGRASSVDRCSEFPEVRRGLEIGSCDNKAHVTKKAIAASLRDSTLAATPVEQSPGYGFIRNFNIDELEISKILKQFGGGGLTGFAAREAVCGWIVDNRDYLERLIPPNHPRVLEYRDNHKTTMVVAFFLGGFAILYVMVSFFISYKKRTANVFLYAQVQFIFVVLFGLLLVAIASMLYAVEYPGDKTCAGRIWLVCLGYTFELVPLIIKVTALNRLMKASKKMRRIRINMNHLYSSVAGLTGLVTVYLTVWTLADPFRSMETRILEEDSSTIISQIECRSMSIAWQSAFNFWEGLLIVWTSVLAFQSRTTKAEFNESRSLGMMIYSHCVFLILRIVVGRVFENDPRTYSITMSFLLSLDIIVALTIYLLPKMFRSYVKVADRRGHFLSRFSWRKKDTTIADPGGPSSSHFSEGDFNSSFPDVSVVSERVIPQSNQHRRISSTTVTATSQSQEFRRVSFSVSATQRSVKSLDRFSDSDAQLEDSNSERPVNSIPSVDAWVGQCNNESGDHDDDAAARPENHLHKSQLQNRRKMESQGDSDKSEELRGDLLQRDQEVLELRREVQILQETNARQESRINELLESQKQE